jgi:hypothetical protein
MWSRKRREEVTYETNSQGDQDYVQTRIVLRSGVCRYIIASLNAEFPRAGGKSGHCGYVDRYGDGEHATRCSCMVKNLVPVTALSNNSLLSARR